MSSLKDHVFHWKKKLERNTDESIILNVIHKLSKAPITYELLQETGVGKVIRTYAKKKGIIGDKAKSVLQKWREIVSQKTQDIPSNCADKKISHKKSNHEKEKFKIHTKVPLSEIESYNAHGQSISTYSSDNNEDESFCQKQAYIKSDITNSKYIYEKLEGSSAYIDYDPNCNVNLGYSPDHPEMYPGSHRSSSTEEKKSKSIDHKSNGFNSSAKKRVAEVDQSEPKECVTKNKKLKLKPDDTKASFVSINGKDKSSTESLSNGARKEKKSIESSGKSNVKHLEHQSKKNSSETKTDVKHKVSKEIKDGSSNIVNKLSNKSSSQCLPKVDKKKSELKLKVKEEFTADEVSFEDCLGLNDIVSFKKKKSSSKSAAKKEERKEKVKKEKVKKEKKSEVRSKGDHSEVRSKGHHSEKTKYEFNNLTNSHPLQDLDPLPQLSEVDILSTLPQTQPNYRPLPQRSADFSFNMKKTLTNEDAIKFTSSRREKTAVYSGRRNVTYTEVPTLYNACIQVLIENIDAIEHMGGTPYFLIKPVMERCTPTQLYNIENYNPYLLDDTQELWQIHCKRDYRNQLPQENETWRDLYMRALDERERRLKTLTANISASMSKSNPVRKAKLAYVDAVVKPPRDVARKQAKHGTGLPVNHTVKAGPPSKATPRPTAPVINSTESVSAAPVLKKPKIAPLMAKTLKSMRQCFRR